MAGKTVWYHSVGKCARYAALLYMHVFHVGENFKTDGYVITPKTMDLIKEHLRQTGGKVHSSTHECNSHTGLSFLL